MTDGDYEFHRTQHHENIRRAKRLLRFMPRRATVHRYPVLQWFAGYIRNRPYLWSFKVRDCTPAFYAGSILTLLPVMGIQTPLALCLALLLRCNLPVMIGLQMITNPFTAAPIYGATGYIGWSVIHWTGFGVPISAEQDEPPPAAALPPAPENAAVQDLTEAVTEDKAQRPSFWSKYLRHGGTILNSLVIGGTLCGVIMGAICDVLYRFATYEAQKHNIHLRLRRHGSAQTDSTPEPPPPD